MKRIAIVTLFPEMLVAITENGVVARAFKEQKLAIRSFNPRDYTTDKHRTVDDRPYGGGPGMVMLCEPLEAAVKAAKLWLTTDSGKAGTELNKDVKVVYLSPQGRRFDHSLALQSAQSLVDLILVAGRYEGVDERFIQRNVDDEWSLGDFVLSGGELAAMAMVDAISRFIPGVLGHEDSAMQDSFACGGLDCPHYTRPEVYKGQAVPAVLLGGNHADIKSWRENQSALRTSERRPDLLQRRRASKD